MTISFSIPCNPPTATSQQKGAFRTPNGIRFFKKARLKQAEASLYYLLKPYVPTSPLQGPLDVSVLWSFPWRKSELKRNRALGVMPCDVRPDLSNIVKLLEDTMTTLRFWEDDSQISRLTLRKQWGDWSGIAVEIQQVNSVEEAMQAVGVGV